MLSPRPLGRSLSANLFVSPHIKVKLKLWNFCVDITSVEKVLLDVVAVADTLVMRRIIYHVFPPCSIFIFPLAIAVEIWSLEKRLIRRYGNESAKSEPAVTVL